MPTRSGVNKLIEASKGPNTRVPANQKKYASQAAKRTAKIILNPLIDIQRIVISHRKSDPHLTGIGASVERLDRPLAQTLGEGHEKIAAVAHRAGAEPVRARARARHRGTRLHCCRAGPAWP